MLIDFLSEISKRQIPLKCVEKRPLQTDVNQTDNHVVFAIRSQEKWL